MPLLTLACLTIIYANLVGDYSIEYTYRVSNSTTPTFLRITALWGGQNGSILFWNWLMSLYIFFVFLRPWKSNRDLLPWVIAVSIGTQAFFILLTIFFANPFARLFVDAAGNISAAVFQPAGLTAVYRSPDGHRPQSAAASPRHDHPSADVVSGLRRTGDSVCVCDRVACWPATRPIVGSALRGGLTLIAWLFLSVGLLLGARWAYDVLGWGGYWGWDPVENSALAAVVGRDRVPA